MNIDDLELTIRSSNALKNAGITTVEQLVNLDFSELSAIKNAGEKSITEICWACMQLLNGKILERAMEWDAKYPPRPNNWHENAEKAKRYDKIAAIVQPNYIYTSKMKNNLPGDK